MAEARKSRDLLGVEKIGLWQLHRVDPNVPRDEQFDAMRMLLDQAVIQHAGLSNVSVADIEARARCFPVATVQNRYNLVDRSNEDVLIHCERNGIGFIPGIRSPPAIWQSPALPSMPSPSATARRRARWRSPGSSSAVR